MREVARSQKFETKDKPLSDAQVEDFGRIRVKDVRLGAIALSADRELRPFLDALNKK